MQLHQHCNLCARFVPFSVGFFPRTRVEHFSNFLLNFTVTISFDILVKHDTLYPTVLSCSFSSFARPCSSFQLKSSPVGGREYKRIKREERKDKAEYLLDLHTDDSSFRLDPRDLLYFISGVFVREAVIDVIVLIFTALYSSRSSSSIHSTTAF